ncbi:hypothetical protein PSTG_18152 [Puccinia striiformis f. sp. tritici PST-78]|uniref:Uncharacterized protein n=1 Tax=Puccinia striiformis f. sp. tritici PST-78 TaxID=1165861 RepID=A0A0L0UN15_9BASI|nr:hypothetical protein PSTG_18152 [Puccinia striiformis f. sp. tritici PST-78]
MEDSRQSTQFFEDDTWKMDLIDVESVDWEELRSEPPNDGEVFNQHMALEWGTNSNPEWEAWHTYRADMFIQPQFRQVFSWPRKRKNTALRPTWLHELPGGGWQKEPPKLRKICALQVDDWETVDIAEETIGGKLLQEIMEDSRQSTQFFEDDTWKMDLIDVESVDWEELRSEPPNDGEVFNQHMALEWGTNSNPEWEAWHTYRADMFIQPQFRQVFSWPRKRKNTALRPTWLHELPGGGLNLLEFR